MPDRHKANPVTFRPPEDDRAWLYAHAEATGRSVGAILTEALKEARRAAHLDNSTVSPSRPVPPDPHHEHGEGEQQGAGRQHGGDPA